jgi:hypothetical protein
MLGGWFRGVGNAMKYKALAVKSISKDGRKVGPGVAGFRALYCEVSFYWRTVMNSHRTLCIGSLVLLIICASCGGPGSGGLITANIAPATVTIAPGSEVTLQASATGPGSQLVNGYLWDIEELTGNGEQCDWMGDTPPAGPCPYGTIKGDLSSTVTYFAPSTSGTFTVGAEVTLSSDKNMYLSKGGTSVITVGP